jgi:hypothetical protein
MLPAFIGYLKRVAIFENRLARFKFLFLRMSLSQNRGTLLRDMLWARIAPSEADGDTTIGKEPVEGGKRHDDIGLIGAVMAGGIVKANSLP